MRDQGRIEGVVYIVDDDPLVAESISVLLESFGIASETLETGEALLGRLPLPSGASVLCDVRMPGMTGLGLLEALREREEPAPVVLITGHADVDVAVAAFRNGAADFLRKPFSNTELVEVVQRARRRAAAAAESAQGGDAARARLADLSRRELEVARLVARGMSNKEAGRELGISYRTVEHHRGRVMEKTGCGSAVQLFALLNEAGEL